MTYDVVVVGAGMAGLACAARLQEQGVSALVLDAAEHVGGRVWTDECEGFLLDRGFQVLLTAYPQTRRLLDFDALQLKGFHAGALIRMQGHFTRVGDPTRHPADLLPTAFSSVGTLLDKASVVRLRQRVCRSTIDDVLARPETTTHERLSSLHFSDEMIQRFFRPFLGGIFLETDLVTSSRKFEFVFRMFSLGLAALPREGMRAIPRQLSAKLSGSQIRLAQHVTSIDESGVELQTGERISARQVVIATDGWIASKLLHREVTTPAAEVTCLYFAAPSPPFEGCWLVLNGEGFGPINNLVVPSNLHPTYAPGGKSLVSVTVLNQRYLGRDDLLGCVRAQLFEWYGPQTKRWQYLKSHRIQNAVPVQIPPALTPVRKPARAVNSIVQCGDYLDISSIEGAVASGIRAAQTIVEVA